MAEQADSDGRGVVYLSRIPHGFYEPQMKHFFEQFGHVTRLKLWRSKKSGKPKGFAYVEFEYEDVAKIVSETMDNYLMYRKLLKCKFIPKAELKHNAFSNAHRRFIPPYHRDVSVRRHNRLLNASRDHILENQRRLVLKEKKRKKKMEALGITCNLPGYADEWKDIQKAHAIVAEKERLEALKRKEIEMKKQEAIKRAKDKVKARSKKRRIAQKLRLKAEKRKSKQQQQQQEDSVQASASPAEEAPAESEKSSPKRKSLDPQNSAVSSTKEANNQPRRKMTKLASSTPKVTASGSISDDKEDASTDMEPRKQLTRMSLRSQGKPRKSLEVGLKTFEKTPSKSLAVTPKSIIKSSIKKEVLSPRPTPKTSARNRKQPPEKHVAGETPVASSTITLTKCKAKTPKREPASDDFEMSDDFGMSDSTEEESKIPKFTGITLTESEKKRDGRLKRGTKHPKIKIHGDQLLLF